jgi:sialic acid synthase SpsE
MMKLLNSTNETYVIAEIGNNHNGSKEKAKLLVDVAAKAGVDAVKFQSFRGLDIVNPLVRSDAYPGWNAKNFEFWYQFLDTIALPLADHQEIIDYCAERKLDFITTPVSPEIVTFLETLHGIKAYKIASMDLNNLGLLEAVAKTNKPVIMSTGMGEMDEIKSAANYFTNAVNRLSILHCVSDYPLDPLNAGLQNIQILQKNFPQTSIGFSDHSLGHELVIAAVALGASIIEKHITLDRKDPALAEHHFSLESDELALMTKWIRAVDKNLSNEQWARSSGEEKNRTNFRRSFHYKKDLPAGHTISKDDLVFIRPGTGIGHNEVNKIIGRQLVSSKKSYMPCMESDT